VMNGDLLTDLDMSALYAEHLESDALGTIATYERDVKIDFGVLRYGDDRRVKGFVEKPVEHFSVSMGIYAFSKRILDLIPEDRPFGFDELVLASIDRGLDVRAFPHDGYWLDIGRPDDYDRANEDVDGLIERLLG